MRGFFESQLDYIFFIYGFSFLLLAAYCWSLRRSETRLSWIWLMLFGLAHGLGEWLDLIALTWPGGATFAGLRLALMAVSFIFLFEFGRSALQSKSRRMLGSCAFLLLVSLACLGGAINQAALNATVRYTLGLSGGLLSATALLHAARSQSIGRRELCVAGVSMAFYALAAGFVVPAAPFFPASLINHGSFFAALGFPIQLLRCVLAFVIAASIWRYARALRLAELAEWGLASRRNFAFEWMVLALLLFFAGGWILSDRVGHAKDSHERETLLTFTRISAAAIDPMHIRNLTGSLSDLQSPDYRGLKEQIQLMLNSITGARFIHILQERKGQIIFLLNSRASDLQHESLPGDLYNENTTEETAVLKARKAGIFGPYVEKDGTFITGVAPIIDSGTGEVIALLEIDLDATAFKHAISELRLMPIQLTGVFCILLLLAIAYNQDFQRLTAQMASSEEKYRRQFTNNRAALLLSDLSTQMILDANPAACSLYGYSKAEILSKRISDLCVPGKEASQAELFQQTDSFSGVHQLSQRSASGRTFDVEVYSSLVASFGRSLVHSIIMDISERKRMEQALQDSKRQSQDLAELFQTLAEVSPVGIFRTDCGGSCIYVNSRWQSISGLSLEAALGSDWLNSIHPEDRARVSDEWNRCMQKKLPFRAEYRVQRPDGTIGRVLGQALAEEDESRIIGYVGTLTDISELRALESQLMQAQKIEAIGTLAAGIAHEMNTPAQYVTDNLSFLQQSTESINQILRKLLELRVQTEARPVSNEEWQELLATVQGIDLQYLLDEISSAVSEALEGMGRITKIVRAMKSFAHPETLEKHKADINKAIEDTVTITRNEWKYVAELKLALDPSLPPVTCLLGELNQVILNLIVNAAQAIAEVVGNASKGKGLITISTLWETDWMELRVSDNGPGIPENIREKVFDPFFTTKEVGQGSGQGLAIAHTVIVEKHEGKIWFETEVGKGTTFFIRLPIKAAS